MITVPHAGFHFPFILYVVLHYLGVCLLNQNRCTEAEALLREALQIRKKCLVENDVRTASCECFVRCNYVYAAMMSRLRSLVVLVYLKLLTNLVAVFSCWTDMMKQNH